MLLFLLRIFNKDLHNFVIKCYPTNQFGIDNVDICILMRKKKRSFACPLH